MNEKSLEHPFDEEMLMKAIDIISKNFYTQKINPAEGLLALLITFRYMSEMMPEDMLKSIRFAMEKFCAELDKNKHDDPNFFTKYSYVLERSNNFKKGKL